MFEVQGAVGRNDGVMMMIGDCGKNKDEDAESLELIMEVVAIIM